MGGERGRELYSGEELVENWVRLWRKGRQGTERKMVQSWYPSRHVAR